MQMSRQPGGKYSVPSSIKILTMKVQEIYIRLKVYNIYVRTANRSIAIQQRKNILRKLQQAQKLCAYSDRSSVIRVVVVPQR